MTERYQLLTFRTAKLSHKSLPRQMNSITSKSNLSSQGAKLLPAIDHVILMSKRPIYAEISSEIIFMWGYGLELTPSKKSEFLSYTSAFLCYRSKELNFSMY